MRSANNSPLFRINPRPYTTLGNPALTSIAALGGLVWVGDSLGVWDNDALTSLHGLESVTNLPGDLIIADDDALPNLTGLDNLATVSGSVYVGYNSWPDGMMYAEGSDALTSFDDIMNLRSIDGSLSILHNFALTDVRGPTALAYIGADLEIDDDPALAEADALALAAGITTIGGTTTISP